MTVLPASCSGLDPIVVTMIPPPARSACISRGRPWWSSRRGWS